MFFKRLVVPYIGTWIETVTENTLLTLPGVVPYIGTWIETYVGSLGSQAGLVVPYIGTWIETIAVGVLIIGPASYLI